MSISDPQAATYGVTGMTCNGCVKSVTKALNRAMPALDVDVSLSDGTVTVAGEHTAGEVAEAVEAAGFDYTGPVESDG